MAIYMRRERRVVTLCFLLFPILALVVAVAAAAGQNDNPESPAQELILFDFTRVGHPLFTVTDFVFTPDGRLLVTEKAGRVKVIQPDGDINPQPFLDLSGQVSLQGEEGLVSIALHPEYDQNGYFYVNYTDLDEISRIVRYEVSTSDPDVANPNRPLTLLSVPQPSPMHNGGKIAFGPDGYLYLGFGDGGPLGDPYNNGQDGLTLLGTILRIDVDNPDRGKPYGIPDDNPFLGDPTVLDEIWAMGLRNPWRFSFDRLNGDLYIGDVGDNSYEEVDLEKAPSQGGFNYGWRCYEGPIEAITDGCQDHGAHEFPIYALPHPEIDPEAPLVCAVVGGMVHRGDPASPLYGRYLFGDYCTGRLWVIGEDQANQWQVSATVLTPKGYVTAFGQDESGELYVADLGNIYRISARSVTAFPRAFVPLAVK